MPGALPPGEAVKSAAREELTAVFHRIRARARAMGAPSLAERLELLARLEQSLLARKNAIADAVSRDFGHRSRHETLLADVFPVTLAIRHARANLPDWMAVQPREAGPLFAPSKAEVVFQPLGVVGILSPWNYPVQLALSPLVSVLAAGNRALIKPSELTPSTSSLLAEILSSAGLDEHVAVVCGGPDVGEAFAHLPFDHLVFTGSARVGKLVMRAASENLVPVTLELGGKCPAIVGLEANVRTAAERIMAGKTLNAGQTCITPDYALVPVRLKDAFVEACRNAVAKMYPTLAQNPDYTSLVSATHYERVRSLADDARALGATLVELGPPGEPAADPTTRKVAPILVLDPQPGMRCMTEEIFGPLLPVVTYERLSDAISHVQANDRPLALYYFGHDEAAIERVLRETTSGGVTVNETILHLLQDDLPFGGVGASGMGRYHGRDGFAAFSHEKATFRQSPLSATGLFKPPYGWAARTLLRFMLGN
jgi:coniferyl-aldehyde dehydrogenase